MTISRHKVQLPTASMFIFHKLLTFIQRENKEKLKKDLYYAYYMLRFCPEKENLINNVRLFIKNKKEEGKCVRCNINKYFENIDSEGPVLVEQENGPDPYVDDLREDIFERFNRIRELLYK